MTGTTIPSRIRTEGGFVTNGTDLYLTQFEIEPAGASSVNWAGLHQAGWYGGPMAGCKVISEFKDGEWLDVADGEQTTEVGMGGPKRVQVYMVPVSAIIERCTACQITDCPFSNNRAQAINQLPPDASRPGFPF